MIRKTSKLEVPPPGGEEKKKGTSIRKLSGENEFGDKNDLETGLNWD